MANLSSPYNESGRDSRVRSDRVVRNAVAQVVESGQQLISDRLDLAQTELKLTFEEYAQRGAAFAAGGSLAAAGFVIFTYGLVQLLNIWLPVGASALIVGGAYLSVGGGLLYRASQQHKARLSASPVP